MRALITVFVILLAYFSGAQAVLEKMSRIAVFPVLVDSGLAKEAEEAWYQIREELSANRKFMVASKNFLESKDVLQPRERLKAADVIILGRLLDAEAIITTFFDASNRNLHMVVSETNYGRTVWEGKIKIQSSIPFKEQIVISCHKLVKDFMDRVPYQGYVIVDSIKAKPVYKSGPRFIVQVRVGSVSQIKQGELVQFIEVTNPQYGEFFNQNMKVEVEGEGKILEISDGIAFIELLRTKKGREIKKDQLVRVPSLTIEKKSEIYGYQYLGAMGLTESQLEENKWKKFEEEKKPLITSIAFLFNIVAMVFLAF